MKPSKSACFFCFTLTALTLGATSFAQQQEDDTQSPKRNGHPKRGLYNDYRHEAQANAADFGLAENPSPYSNMLDQNDMDFDNLQIKGAKILRATEPSFGVGYGLATLNYSEKSDNNTFKTTVDFTAPSFFAVWPTPSGLRVGVNYLQMDAKDKLKNSTSSSDSSATIKVSYQKISVSLAAALRNGLGAALTLATNKEETKADFRSIDLNETYGTVSPQLYYAQDGFEAIFSWTPSMRHETFSRVGTYELMVESGRDSIHPYFDITRYRNSENDGEAESDHFKVDGGIRYILDRESNIRMLLSGEEAYYTDRSNASGGNCANYGLLVNGEQVLNAVHVLGYGVNYRQGSGKGKSGQKSSTISADTTGFVFSYKFVMR